MIYKIRKFCNVAIFSTLLFFAAVTIPLKSAKAQDLSELEKQMTKFTLPNGLKFLVFERHEAPVVSFHTYADVGSVDDSKGQTGMAHLFEHMAFKGTTTIGTKDYKAEARAMAKEDEAFEALKAERNKIHPDKARMEQLEKKFKQAGQEAGKYIIPDRFEEMLTQAGGKRFNAYTSEDATQYIVSLPSNKVELWMTIESDRFLNPVLREFYKERDVVMEERRMSENRPMGRLFEEFGAVAYKAHPYGHPVLGWMSDLENISRPQAQAFFKKYYSPANLTIAIVGDVNPQEIKKLAEKYFSPIPGGTKSLLVETVEPPQLGRRCVTIEDTAQPMLLIGYHRPNVNHPDNAVFDAISQIIGSGRTSRLYESLVKEKKIAVEVWAGSDRSKYPSLFVFGAQPAKGHTPQECEKAINDEIEKFKTQQVSAEELQKAKALSRADLLQQLDTNGPLAAELAFYEVVTGDWHNLFAQLDKINLVTAADVQRVAKECFVTKNQTVGEIQTTASN
ncbi:MAG: pitrilysin family protein [Sedimentisphaerales bacterium]